MEATSQEGEHTGRDSGSEHADPDRGPVNVLREAAEQSDERNAAEVVCWLSLVNGRVAKRCRRRWRTESPVQGRYIIQGIRSPIVTTPIPIVMSLSTGTRFAALGRSWRAVG